MDLTLTDLCTRHTGKQREKLMIFKDTGKEQTTHRYLDRSRCQVPELSCDRLNLLTINGHEVDDGAGGELSPRLVADGESLRQKHIAVPSGSFLE